jgi:hypothetical protein
LTIQVRPGLIAFYSHGVELLLVLLEFSFLLLNLVLFVLQVGVNVLELGIALFDGGLSLLLIVLVFAHEGDVDGLLAVALVVLEGIVFVTQTVVLFTVPAEVAIAVVQVFFDERRDQGKDVEPELAVVGNHYGEVSWVSSNELVCSVPLAGSA